MALGYISVHCNLIWGGGRLAPYVWPGGKHQKKIISGKQTVNGQILTDWPQICFWSLSGHVGKIHKNGANLHTVKKNLIFHYFFNSARTVGIDQIPLGFFQMTIKITQKNLRSICKDLIFCHWLFIFLQSENQWKANGKRSNFNRLTTHFFGDLWGHLGKIQKNPANLHTVRKNLNFFIILLTVH